MGEKLARRMTLSEPKPYKKFKKNILKKGVYTVKREGNYIMGLFTFISVVQIQDLC